MTRTTKAEIIAITGYVLTLVAYSFLAAFLFTLLGLPVFVQMIFNFVVVFSFCVSPWYRRYLDWMEELALKYLPKDADV